MYVDIILPLPLEGEYTYSLPTDLEHSVQVGCRVLVSFGKRKLYTGIVVKIHTNTPSYPTKDVLEILDKTPIILQSQFRLWQWIASYYLCQLGEVYKAALPAGLKLESESLMAINPTFDQPEDLSLIERKVWDLLCQKKKCKISEIQQATGNTHVMPLIRRLIVQEVISLHEEVKHTHKPRLVSYVQLTEEYTDEDKLFGLLNTLEKRAPRQWSLLTEFLTLSEAALAIKLKDSSIAKEVLKSQLLRTQETSASTALSGLCEKGVLQILSRKEEKTFTSSEGEIVVQALSQAQQTALEGIHVCWENRPICLLHGVTSSGKTEIYTHVIKEVLEQGKQVLYLLPEIVLTTQLTMRLRRVFGDRMGVYHSKYTDSARVEVYQRMLSECPYDLILGVRSSIFLPFQNLGLVIVDEEHESSFKQQDPAPRYHGRNAAIMLAIQNGAKVLLGSATPSVESYYNVLVGKYGLVSLKNRYQDVQLPKIEVVDTKELQRKRLMRGPFSPLLLDSIREALEQKQQVILFQNRRGYSPTVECATCGWVPRCQHCDVSLTHHKLSQQLVCHYCGAVYPIPKQCPNCQESKIRSHGYGTERIESLIQEIFPTSRVARMDLDTTSSRSRYEQILDDFQQGKTDILVGTQMVTKGLDFERVRVVGILHADTMLNQPDFRSYERAFQMMLQVAGRAGRRGEQGLVILQTRDVECPVIQQVVKNDYESLFSDQLAERELFQFPPYYRLIYVYVKHRDAHTADALSADLTKCLMNVFGNRVKGPNTPFISRIQQLFIRQVVIKLELNLPLEQVHTHLIEIKQYLLAQPTYRAAQVYYDVE